ncbi:hypothetical protein [Gloeocapsopsis dulcis]|uniref:Uncharacterized protein n=1 Tax=Gloeocapsopsis dulcis AAB1 = 1H9 TaxID=1433147 RepID=A0A6N8FWJ0_9CHRO|nr:hypothetical protein [Gloeocapsopsis dulcis]MUL36972.1 hypothetical protein [Gloeocapsopsis dulcis AAB1 = 1H9]WNN88789.1 hypothetical protein P0S91_21350 [Gloeocapsopsis dulcis]
MTPDNVLADSYEQLIAVSQKMLQTRHYEVAFHALQAALHCAEELKDEQRLVTVEQEAKRQRDLIDATAPEHRMSTQAAVDRGGKNLYDTLIRQARVHINQIKLEQRKIAS